MVTRKVQLEPEGEVLTAQEVAAWLRVSVSTIYRQAKGGTMPAFRVAHDYRFNRTQIREWIDRQAKWKSRVNAHGRA